MQRHDVTSTLMRRCINVVCPLVKVWFESSLSAHVRRYVFSRYGWIMKPSRNQDCCIVLYIWVYMKESVPYVRTAKIDRPLHSHSLISLHWAFHAKPMSLGLFRRTAKIRLLGGAGWSESSPAHVSYGRFSHVVGHIRIIQMQDNFSSKHNRCTK